MQAGITSFVSPDPELYTNSKGEVAVPAVFKVNDGFLFPMPSGALCFIERPAMYIPYESIRYVSFARMGGTSSTFDLQVHLRSGETIEFSQIAQGEGGRLQSYCSRVKIKTSAEEAAAAEARAAAARERAAANDGAGPSGVNAEAAEVDEEDSSDEEDEDFDPSEEEGGSSHRASRGAKRKRESGEGAGPSTSKAAESEEDIGEDDEDSDGEDEEDDNSSDEDGSEDIEVVDEDTITAADIAQDMARDRRGGKKGQRLRLGDDVQAKEEGS
ncbi:histone chaperone Rttp106-like-domain-containing protein [Dunaliella salina]|uniref:Histone chaperone Rttp106-like-domain-containing protein n=1 Tax=Dunaliella salina TaxID=3046 RepID=A0ABQ7H4A6_DUNSA|nr:histone chaperone Rttp106-like-domain-containing protein [Dunaliella salina]|eukprot:KAF5841682.1 histone chaperone Rttp106-like-domain-containing protein [Dunaliella salina]